MIALKVLTIDDFFLFQERMHDFALFEFIDHQIIPVQGIEPVEASLVEYVLSPDFEENTIKISFPRATKKHDRIVSNLHGYIRLVVQGKDFFVYSQGTDVWVTDAEKDYKPDVVLVKKDTEIREKHAIINPIVTFEVLSKSTQAKDKTEKLENYRSIESLQCYVLIAQDTLKVTSYQRINQNIWKSQILTNVQDVLVIESIDLSLSLKNIYEEI